MARALTWAAGLTASVLLHAGAGGLYLATRSLDEAPTQQSPQSKLQLDTVTAPRQTAEAQPPEGEAADEAQSDSTALNADAVPQSRAEPLSAPQSTLSAATPDTNPVTATEAGGATVSAATPSPAPLAESASQADRAAPQALTSTTAAPAAPASQPLSPDTRPAPSVAATTLPTSTVASVAPSEPALTAATPDTPRLTTAALPSATTAALAPPSIAAPAAPATGTSLATVQPAAETSTAQQPATIAAPSRPATGQIASLAPTSGETLDQPPLPATSAKAATAWQFGDRIVTDPTALATIEAFMSPQQLDTGQQVRDDLTSVLAGVDCARLSATFIPETGTLELRGHVPDPAMAAPVLAAMQAQVGDGLPVTANLLHLPSPQCGALTGISDVGLPQSTDQFTNSRLIGATAHAREYSYTEGQRLTFDLVAPDYDAFVYVDYFTADGEVVHLVPNDTIALERSVAKSVFGVGQDRPGKPGLRITIGPPFGQEIAVAFAASTPLYDGVRPIIEPAEPYLAYLKDRVTEMRATDPDFKGEWVYFFITTRPATQ